MLGDITAADEIYIVTGKNGYAEIHWWAVCYCRGSTSYDACIYHFGASVIQG